MSPDEHSRPRKRKQLLLKLGVFLLLGAIVNVAVAWGCAAARHSSRSKFGLTDLGEKKHGGYEFVVEFASGLPMRTLHGRVHTIFMQEDRISGMWVTQRPFPNTPRYLPLKPLIGGFAINTIFYAALLWVLWMVPGKIRRLVRIRRGCCPVCGYKIAPGVGNACSECGEALSPRRGAGM